MVGGMLGGMDPAAQKAKLQEVTKSANDITGLVKTKKKEKVPAASGPSDSGSSKRKLEVVEEDAVDGKRAKTEDLV
jgi:HAT1-interacting factor 1